MQHFTTENQTQHLARRALILSYATVIYNVVEGIASIIAGMLAGSIALTGFGLDSAVESLSGMIMVWRFSPSTQSGSEDTERRERIAARLIGASFFIFALYVLYESASKLWQHEHPEPSLAGIVIALLSCITMPVLYRLKQATGKALGSRALIADSKETLACFYLSVSLLAGLLANRLWGLWWADPLVGLLIVWFLVREGFEAFEGEDDDD